MDIILGLAIGLVFFIATITAYIIGIKHGRTIKADGVPNINPIKAVMDVKQDIDTKKQVDLFSEGLNNILNFGEPLSDAKDRG